MAHMTGRQWKAVGTVSMTLWPSPALSIAEGHTVTLIASDKCPHLSPLASSEGSQGGRSLSRDKQRQRVSKDIARQCIYFPTAFLKPKGSAKHSVKDVQSTGKFFKTQTISYSEKT